jgi:hypothetical protein
MKSGFGSYAEDLGARFNEIAVALLREGKPVQFRAVGGSMDPAIRDGETIAVHPVSPAELAVGDVVLFRIEDRLIAHRIHRCPTPENPTFLLRGDAMTETETILPDQILGKVEGASLSPREAATRRFLHRIRRRLLKRKD